MEDERIDELRQSLRSDVAKNMINLTDVPVTNLSFSPPLTKDEMNVARAKLGGFTKKNYDAEYYNN